MTQNIFDKTLEILGPEGEHWTRTSLTFDDPDRGRCYCLLGALVKAATGKEPVRDGLNGSEWVYDYVDEELAGNSDVLDPLLEEIGRWLPEYDISTFPSRTLYRFNDGGGRRFPDVATVLQEASRGANA